MPLKALTPSPAIVSEPIDSVAVFKVSSVILRDGAFRPQHLMEQS
ncbi:hypothetical protein [Sphingobium phenoxybenzoativorans]|nr:hypothetical protein [Sphingobium phenoxybenzoativorans]